MITRIKNKLSDFKNKLIVFEYNLIQRPRQKKQLDKKVGSTAITPNYLKDHADEERSVEIRDEDYLLDDVLFSCYFIKKENPQTGEAQKEANFEYIKEWYQSVQKIDIDAIIIHDGLDDSFIDKYTTDKIKFRRFFAGNHPLIDERWIIYYLFLLKTNIKRAFFTDIGDVVLTKSPFGLISDVNKFFIGRDNANKIYLSGWILNECRNLLSEINVQLPKSFYFQPLYNVGIVGGNRQVMLFVLAKVANIILLSDPSTYKEMTVFNIVVHQNFFPYLNYQPNEKVQVDPTKDGYSTHELLVSGFPLNSAFKGFEHESEAYFIHK